MASYKVLIAEDEGLIARDIATRLENLGHTVVATASTADEAIAFAAGADVVLMDIRLDGHKDGIDAAREIRARHHLPVIFLTAHADVYDAATLPCVCPTKRSTARFSIAPITGAASISHSISSTTPSRTASIDTVRARHTCNCWPSAKCED